MLKKFLIGSIAVLGLGVALSASAAYDFGTTTLKIGSKGEAVKAVQTVVGATPVDGIFGKITAAKVMAWQKANGLTADGLFGKASMAKANGTPVSTTTSTTTTSTTLKGGAGSSDYDTYSTGVKSDIKDGEEDVKVAALKIEAIDSDIAVNNIKLSLTNTNLSSAKPSKFIESVDIYEGSTKVGSADVSDFSKSGTKYSKSISLSNAVVKADEKEPFFVVFNAASDIDKANDAFTKYITVAVDSFRFTDGSGVIDSVDTDSPAISEKVYFDLADSNDVTLKSSSANPDASTITVDEDNSTDDVLALAFKIDNDEDSTSDASIQEVPVVLTFKDNASGTGSSWAEKVIDSVTVNIDGDEYEAELDSQATNAGSGTATYIADVDGDTVIKSGDTVDAKVYISFNEQDGNYSQNTKVSASVANEGVKVDDEDDDSITVGGNDQTGKELTLNTSGFELSKYSWSSASGKSAGTLDFFFTIKAGNDDIAITNATSDIAGTVNGTATTGTLTLISGDAEGSSNSYTVSEGDTANFRVRYTVTTDGAEAKVTKIKGQNVPDEKQLSPTVYLQ